MHTKKTWILIADGSIGKIYDYIYKDSQLNLMKEFSSKDAHLSSAELGSDKPGRSHDSMGGARHSIEPKMDIHKKEKINFIQHIADYLNHSENKKEFDQLFICAASETLGHLRKLLNKQVSSLVTKEINKDLSHSNKNDILEHIKLK